MSADAATVENAELIVLLEQLPEGVMVLDSAHQVLFANKTGARLVKMKPKTVVGQPFEHDVEDGPMRSFDVELTVKEVTWSGQPAKLLHLKSLKSSGAFHLEWKLEAALERARAAEDALAQIQESGPAPPADGEPATSTHEALEEQKRKFDIRIGELESLLEQAEARLESLENDDLDLQSATELQDALSLAREAEDQVRQLEEELAEARDRIRVSEEQAEVAEERAYNLEAELERLESEALDRQEEAEEQGGEVQDEARLELENANRELSAELESVKAELDTLRTELESLRAQPPETVPDEGVLQELDAVKAQLEEKSRLGDEVSTELEVKSHEVERLQAELSAKDEVAMRLSGELSVQATEMESLTRTCEELRAQLDAINEAAGSDSEQLQVMSEQLAAKEASFVELQEELRKATEELTLSREEAEELGEQLKAEIDSAEESSTNLQQEIEGLSQQYAEAEAKLAEQSAELEILRAGASDSEALQSQLQEMQASESERNRLEKEVQKLEARLQEAEMLAAKGEKAEKLERKLEGALRRAEEADERLQEERRLLNELKQRVQQGGASLPPGASPGAGEAEVDPETERLAFQDSLTGLPNHNILHRYLGFMVKQSARHERYTAILRLDLDKFKTINDTLGAKLGDDLIRQIGERLTTVVRTCDVLGRFGEDEFVILLSELNDQKEASVMTAAVIRRIYQILKKPFTVAEQNISIGASIGVSLYPLDAANVEQMFEHSAVALRRAKETGRGQAQYYTADVQTAHEARSVLDHELKSGLERNEFGLLYQPIVDLQSGALVGVEALIRWKHPRMGIIRPDDFLKVAEESGIIVLIGNWAIRAALKAASVWHQQGLNFFVSLNLSRRQLLQADLVPTVQSALNEFQCEPSRVLLEIPESLTGTELPRIRETLNGLQQLGVRLAVDNFGTASTALQDLKRGPFTVLKVDRKFVRGVPDDEENKALVLSALTVGHHLNRVSVAVGVETEKEKAWLAQTGCRFAQGNLLSPPLPPESVIDLVRPR